MDNNIYNILSDDTKYILPQKRKINIEETKKKVYKSKCIYAEFCRNYDCKHWHPPSREPPLPKNYIECKYGLQCTKQDCPYSHDMR